MLIKPLCISLFMAHPKKLEMRMFFRNGIPHIINVCGLTEGTMKPCDRLSEGEKQLLLARPETAWMKDRETDKDIKYKRIKDDGQVDDKREEAQIYVAYEVAKEQD